AGKTVELLRTLKINIDYFRKSTNPKNVEKLKSIKDIDKKRKRERVFTKKEKNYLESLLISGGIKERKIKIYRNFLIILIMYNPEYCILRSFLHTTCCLFLLVFEHL
ncbi:hypothetical protein LCGC14_2751290, partial [marine sediment metagenome]